MMIGYLLLLIYDIKNAVSCTLIIDTIPSLLSFELLTTMLLSIIRLNFAETIGQNKSVNHYKIEVNIKKFLLISFLILILILLSGTSFGIHFSFIALQCSRDEHSRFTLVFIFAIIVAICSVFTFYHDLQLVRFVDTFNKEIKIF